MLLYLHTTHRAHDLSCIYCTQLGMRSLSFYNSSISSLLYVKLVAFCRIFVAVTTAVEAKVVLVLVVD